MKLKKYFLAVVTTLILGVGFFILFTFLDGLLSNDQSSNQKAKVAYKIPQRGWVGKKIDFSLFKGLKSLEVVGAKKPLNTTGRFKILYYFNGGLF